MKKVEGSTILTGVVCFIALLLTVWFIAWMTGYKPFVRKPPKPKAKVAGKASRKTRPPKIVRTAPEEPAGRHKMSPYPPPAPEVKPPPRGTIFQRHPERTVNRGYIPWPQQSPEGGGWQRVGHELIRPNPHDGSPDERIPVPLQSEIIWAQSDNGNVSAANVYGRHEKCPTGFKELKLIKK